MWKLDNEQGAGSAVEGAVTPRTTSKTDRQVRERRQPGPQHRRPSPLPRRQRWEKQKAVGKKSRREMSDSLNGRRGRDTRRHPLTARTRHTCRHGDASVLMCSRHKDRHACLTLLLSCLSALAHAKDKGTILLTWVSLHKRLGAEATCRLPPALCLLVVESG